MISLGQQNGGPNISPSFNETVLSLRKLLSPLRSQDYAPSCPEFALILRVDGSLTRFGKEGVEPPKFRKRYVQVDIVVPEERWEASAEAQEQYLRGIVREALAAVISAFNKKKLPIDGEKLMRDYASLLAVIKHPGTVYSNPDPPDRDVR